MNSSEPPPLPQTSSLEEAVTATPPVAPSTTEDAAARIGFNFTDPQSPLTPYLLRTSGAIAVAVLAAIFLYLCFVPLWHTDVWAHVKFGRWIVEHRELPTREPFCIFADKEAPYIHFQWLTQSGLYLLFHAGERLAGGDELHRLAGGAEALQSAFLLLNLLRYVVLLLAYRRLTGSMALACVGVVVDFLFLSKVQRPQVVGELLFACLLLALSRPVLSRRALLLIPICMILWANMHGSYLVGLALLGVFFLGRVIFQMQNAECRMQNEKQSVFHSAFCILHSAFRERRLLLVGLLSVAGIALLNPHGPRLFLYTLQLSKHPNIPTLEEWQPIDFHWGTGGQWAYLFLLLLLLVSQALSSRVLSPTALLLLASFGVFPLLQQRMMTWWIVLVPWLVLPLWSPLGDRFSGSADSSKLGRGHAGRLLANCFALMLVFLALMFSPPVQWLRARGPHSLDRTLSPGTPWKLAAQLKATPDDKTNLLPELTAALHDYPDGRFQGRIFASETQGDYLLWALPAEYPVFVYTHVHLFSPQHWLDCLTVKGAGGGWWEILDRYGVNLVVVEAEQHPALTKALKADPAWQIVLDESDPPSKRDPRTRLLIALRKKPRRS